MYGTVYRCDCIVYVMNWKTERSNGFLNVELPACQKQLSTTEKVNFGCIRRKASKKVTLTMLYIMYVYAVHKYTLARASEQRADRHGTTRLRTLYCTYFIYIHKKIGGRNNVLLLLWYSLAVRASFLPIGTSFYYGMEACARLCVSNTNMGTCVCVGLYVSVLFDI